MNLADASAFRDDLGEIAQRRVGRHFYLEARQWLPAEPETVWRFVSDCRHMNEVIPDFIQFKLLSETRDGVPPTIAPGVTYEYRLKLNRIGVFWRTLIGEVDRPHYFYDTQAKGPYADFKHEHFFEAVDGGTLTRDIIRYRPPGGPLARWVDALYVGPSLRRLFSCRHEKLAKLFTDHQDPAAALLQPAQS